MSLARKQRGIKFRFPEILGIGLLITVAVFCALSFNQMSHLNWIKARARVIGVTTPTSSRMLYSPISSTQNGIAVLYEFETGNQIIKGSWSSNWLSTPIVKSLAPELIQTIENIKSVHIGSVPYVVAQELNASTKSAEPSIAAELNKSLRGEDFYNVSSVRRKSLNGIMPTEVEIDKMRSILTERTPAFETQSSKTPGIPQHVMQAPPEINIRFDPSDPNNNTLNYPGFNLQIPAVMINTILFIMTLIYFTRTYPSLKLRGY